MRQYLRAALCRKGQKAVEMEWDPGVFPRRDARTNFQLLLSDELSEEQLVLLLLKLWRERRCLRCRTCGQIACGN